MSDYTSLSGRQDFLNRCTRCNHCKFVPVINSKEHASICPSADYGEFHSFSAGGQVIIGAGLVTGHVDYTPGLIDAMSACTMCGGCDVSCKINHGEVVEPLDSLYALRKQVVQDGHSPAAHQTIIKALRASGNAAGLPRAERNQWARSLAEPLGMTKNADVLFHIGANLSYDQAKYQTLQSLVNTVRAAGIKLTYLGTEEDSSGSTAFDLGYQEEAKFFAKKFAKQVASLKVDTVVTFSAAAIAAYRGIYPRLGVNLEGVQVLHITEYIENLVNEGLLSLAPSEALAGKSVAYHDSCKLGRLSEAWQPHDLSLEKTRAFYLSRAPEKLRFGNDGIYESPRTLLREMGANLIALQRERASSYCCGAAGGVRESVPEAANLAARKCLSEAETVAANTLVSGCGNCASHMNGNNDKQTSVLDLLDLLGASLKVNTSVTEGRV